MSHSVYIASPEGRTGKSTVALGVLEALAARSDRVGVFRPVYKPEPRDYAVDLLISLPAVEQSYEDAMGVDYTTMHRDPERAHAEILRRYQELREQYSALVILGSDFVDVANPNEVAFNAEVAANIGAPVVMVVSGLDRTPDQIATLAAVSCSEFESHHAAPLALVVNRYDGPDVEAVRTAVTERLGEHTLVAVIPENPVIQAPTVKNLKDAVAGRLVQGNPEWLGRVSLGTVVAAMSLPNVLERISDNYTVIAPGDRYDLLPALYLAQQSGTFPTLASIVLTGGYGPAPAVTRLLEGVQQDLPVLVTDDSTFDAALSIARTTGRLTADSPQKIDAARRAVAENLATERLLGAIDVARSEVVTPMMFEFELLARARGAKKRIVLPEGDEPRILAAAEVLLARGVADLILLGDETAIRSRASQLGHDISEARIVSPQDPELLEKYAAEYARLRAKKGVTLEQARERIQDVSYFGTMMVQMGEADGMVSGAVHSTAHTIRPSFEIIKTKPDAKIVSSVFLMALEDRVLVYGDCAVNPDPTAEQLADIAVQSATTAAQFGVEPRVAMLSYSTGTSGSGADVDKVREATELVRASNPGLDVEGPIQYDAAVDASVAKTKLPDSAVAGRATVFVFPDLNTGNNTYKAVQRSAGAVAIGPVLQGLNKPVNDLSRGALVDDIINTVVITAIQAQAADTATRAGETA
ncbi:phosphate acetyltransferase [Brachybacterium huguangmaarense]|uniref:Phosphate acetyltransferase n=1 Tax=Brachybacterium huguangmaarense TaxID=1652028 RepID=A0ABY6G1M1_9MICO|nr:phosphate acetyltransferase [Brachybacterium huguangmaarense]UYG17107.1 phosphate acetyltransferase [Brachybacterium huguangmaarense]